MALLLLSCKKEASVNEDPIGQPPPPPPPINYPMHSNLGLNILNDTVTHVGLNGIPGGDTINYSLAAKLPPGALLKVVMSHGNWTLTPERENWAPDSVSSTFAGQRFLVIEAGKPCDIGIKFLTRDTIRIEYFEKGPDTPSRIRNIIVI